MTGEVVVLCTCGSEEEAERLGTSLVESRLAACVNIVPRIRSVYRWQGAVERADEWMLVVKSSRHLFSAIQAEVAKLHSYETPELIALPIVEGEKNYLNWLANSVRREAE
jgi:periplasmic divalent cation tolerance protein